MGLQEANLEEISLCVRKLAWNKMIQSSVYEIVLHGGLNYLRSCGSPATTFPNSQHFNNPLTVCEVACLEVA